MELRQLRYFIAVAETENFRRAANVLSLAQPALSRQIMALEKELGVTLFERLPRGVQLTRAGQVFLQDARRILEEISTAGVRAKRIARGQIGTLRIAFSEAMSGHDVLTQTIRSFRAAYADVEIILVPMATVLQIDALRNGTIDAGFQYRRAFKTAEFGRHEMAKENIVLALPQTHPLATAKAIRLKDLRDEPLICVAQHINPDFYGAVMSQFVSAAIVPRIVQEASSVIVLSLVAVDMGLGIVSSAMRWHVPQGVVFRPIQGLSLPSAVDLVWHKSETSPALAKFIENAARVAKTINDKTPAKRRRPTTP